MKLFITFILLNRFFPKYKNFRLVMVITQWVG